MGEAERVSRFRRLWRSLVEMNLFETDDTDERTIYVQRWTTRVYICVLYLCICILLVQNGLRVETTLIEVKNPSLGLYVKLRNVHPDINCPCSQISASYRSFLTLTPVYHPVCSSGFISQTWIELLVDNLTSFRFPGDFRATASTQFQILRELCRVSETFLNNNIESLYDTEFISGALLSESRWHTETGAVVSALYDSGLTSFQHRLSFIGWFVTLNFLISGIQAPFVLLVELEHGVLVVNPRVNAFRMFDDGEFCGCDDHGSCLLFSGFFDAGMFDNKLEMTHNVLESKLSLQLENWYVGCWALQSLLQSSFSDSFVSNQTTFDLVATYFDWPSNVTLPTVLNLNESNKTNMSNGIFSYLLQSLFTENLLTKLNYSIYFEQCQAQSCFYPIRHHSSFLYIITLLLALYGGLSIVLKFLIPYVVAFLIKRLKPPIEAADTTGEFESGCC